MTYVEVEVTILGLRPHAIRGRVNNEMVWLPRSTLEDNGQAADDAILARKFLPTVTLKVAQWKAREYGWT